MQLKIELHDAVVKISRLESEGAALRAAVEDHLSAHRAMKEQQAKCELRGPCLLCVCAHVCARACVRVCVRERERESWRRGLAVLRANAV